MTVREIPAAYEYVCDVCGKMHRHGGAPLFDGRPPYWARLIIEQHAYDYQGSACADASIERLLCDDCRDGVGKAINAWAETRKKA